MILPYLARLACLCLAALFLFHAAAGLLVSALVPWAIRLAGRAAPGAAARFLLVLRLFPASFALLLVAGLCAPSYLWLEPEAVAEPTGLACLAAALMGLAVCGLAAARATRALVRTLRYIRQCRKLSREIRLRGEPEAAWLIDAAAPVAMLAGIARPRLVISASVVAALPAEQLGAVVRHERAHRRSRDNLKRLLLLLAPDLLPFVRGFRNLERAWARMAEWAADDWAAGGDARRSLALAAALVRVARLGSHPPTPVLATALLADGADLPARVDRLLRPVRPVLRSGRREPVLRATAGLLLAGALAAVLANPAALHSAHEFLELLIR